LKFNSSTLLALLSLLPITGPATAQPGSIEPQECLAIGRVGTSSRSPIHTDAIEAQIVAGKWSPPRLGDTVTRPDGATATWSALKTGSDGSFPLRGFAGGYAYFAVPSNNDRVVLLEAQGYNMVYVNGVPRTGDPYSNGLTRLPIKLNNGTNNLLFLVGRDSMRIKLLDIARGKSYLLDTRDSTLPDLRVGEKLHSMGAVIVVNATEHWSGGLTLHAHAPGFASRTVSVPPIPPLASRKIGFPIEGRAPDNAEKVRVDLELVDRRGKRAPDTASVDLRVRKPNQTYMRTFVSEIDGSVQYYAVNPARPPVGDKSAHALFLSLHGAGVQAIGQADAYNGKAWGDIVCPTNRRPYGFDWEDWGEIDAMEVLSIARKELHTDPARTYLTGHSMGGHGTWHIGVTYPDKFAAIGPSAGWISFFTYGGGSRPVNPTPMQQTLLTASTPSDTLALEKNYGEEGVYILHGDADDNVPVEQAREMKRRLAAFQPDVGYHEQHGAGHWWGNSDEPGAACVDWPPMFDFFAHHELAAPEMVRQIDFATANPGVSASDRWVTIEQQIQPLQVSSVSIRLDPGKRRFVGTTVNTARLTLDLSSLPADGPVLVDLGGKKLEDVAYPKSGKLSLVFDGTNWTAARPLPDEQKNPQRNGPFKLAFQHRMEFVYGTAGTEADNVWALDKARYDAETFWYRGNGSVDIVSDTDFLKQTKQMDRSVILYGSSSTNRAYDTLLRGAPIQVEPGKVTIRGKAIEGDDLACLFVQPRPGSATAYVAVIGGTGAAGSRLTDRLPYFVSGAAFPDYIVYGSDALLKGADGVRAAGFFDNGWR